MHKTCGFFFLERKNYFSPFCGALKLEKLRFFAVLLKLALVKFEEKQQENEVFPTSKHHRIAKNDFFIMKKKEHKSYV